MLALWFAPSCAADLVIIGDSVSATSDEGAWRIGEGYGAIVAAKWGMTEVNLAQSGATVVPVNGNGGMRGQWDKALARNPLPAHIIAQLGENDIWWQTDIGIFTATIDADVASAVKLGIAVTINTSFHRRSPQWYRHAPAYVQAVRDIARKYRCDLVDVYAFFEMLSKSDEDFASYFYGGDGIDAHPTAAGQRMIADLVLK